MNGLSWEKLVLDLGWAELGSTWAWISVEEKTYGRVGLGRAWLLGRAQLNWDMGHETGWAGLRRAGLGCDGVGWAGYCWAGDWDHVLDRVAWGSLKARNLGLNLGWEWWTGWA